VWLGIFFCYAHHIPNNQEGFFGKKKQLKQKLGTLIETNLAADNGWLEDWFPFGMPIFRSYVGFWGE